MTFTWSIAAAQGSQLFTELGQAKTRYLSTETAGGFTGVCLGLFATGNGQPARAPAGFDAFTYLTPGAPAK